MGKTKAPNSSIGIRSGLSYSSVYGDPGSYSVSFEDIGYKTSYHIGVFNEFRIKEDLSIQPELNYSRKGYRKVDYDRTFNFNYIDIATLIKYRLYSEFYIETGLAWSYLLNDNHEGFKQRRFDLSAIVGANYMINEWLGAGIRFNQGLTSFIKESNFQLINSGDYFIGDDVIGKKHRFFQLSTTIKPVILFKD